MALLRCFVFLLCLLAMANGVKVIRLPALGRPFRLGSLYNLKDDQMILGPKPWRQDQLANFTQTLQPKSSFQVTASDSFENAKSLLGISSQTALSILIGSTKVSGSAAFFEDRVMSSNIARVELKFDTRTFIRELKPSFYTKVDFPAVLERVPDATHVVVGIEYGAAAFFQFDRKVSEKENKEDVLGNMTAAIQEIPGLSLSSKTEKDVSPAFKLETDKFSCKVHGDFMMGLHPGKFFHAVEAYKLLPRLLGREYENSVPMRVWLYPLDALPISRANARLYDVRSSLIHQIMVQIENLHKLEVQSNDLLELPAVNYFPRVRVQILQFKENVVTFTLRFKQALGQLLPAARSSGNETDLTKMLNEKETSIFSQLNLASWIRETREEVNLLGTTLRLVNNREDDGNFVASLLNEVRYTLVLTLRLTSGEDKYLAAMNNHLTNTLGVQMSSNHADFHNNVKDKWWTNISLLSNLHKKGRSFSKFYDLQAKMKTDGFVPDVQLLVREVKADVHSQGVFIELFEYAKLIDANYEIPLAPSAPIQDKNSQLKKEFSQSQIGLFMQNKTYSQNSMNFFHPEGKPNEVLVYRHPEMKHAKLLVQNRNFQNKSVFKDMYWVDYKKGFGLPFSDEYWIGLQRLHEITKNGRWSVVFEVVWENNKSGSKDPRNGTLGMLEFSDFKVQSEMTNFKLSVGKIRRMKNWHQNAETSNQYIDAINGMAFSTRDRDNDKHTTGNCARSHRGGWWFNSCWEHLCLNCGTNGVYDHGWRFPANSTIYLRQLYELKPKMTQSMAETDINEGGDKINDLVEDQVNKVVFHQVRDVITNQVTNMIGETFYQLSKSNSSNMEIVMQNLSASNNPMSMFYSERQSGNVRIIHHPMSQEEKILVQTHNFHDKLAFQEKFWVDYKWGFGKPFTAEYWIGLQKMHEMTRTGRWSIIFEVVWDKNKDGTQDAKNGTTGMVEFGDFKVYSEASHYKVSTGKFRRKSNWRENPYSINSRIRAMDGMAFSTSDRDNDVHNTANCAGSQGEWWFRNCHEYLCLNCRRSLVVHDSTWRLPANSTIWLKRIA